MTINTSAPPNSAVAGRASPRALAGGGFPRILRLVGAYLLTLVLVVTVVFALPRAMPGDPLVALQDPSSGGAASPEVSAHLRAYYGLDRPVADQYVHYLSRLAQGDLGWSISRNVAVSSLITEHLPWTLLLLGLSFSVAAMVSFAAGVLAAWRRGRLADRALLVTMTALRALPPYVLAALLLVGLAVIFPVLPLAGARTPFVRYVTPLGTALDLGRHLVLPTAALSLSLLSTKFLLVRNTMLSSLGQDYMVLARAKGLPERLLKYRHGGRNALLPFMAAMGVEAGFAVGFSIFVESVFAYPGIGTLILRAVETRDYPVLEAAFLVLAALVLAGNLIVEVVSARLDPRVATR